MIDILKERLKANTPSMPSPVPVESDNIEQISGGLPMTDNVQPIVSYIILEIKCLFFSTILMDFATL